MLYPIAPHIAHALWDELGFAARIRRRCSTRAWPEPDEAALQAEQIELVVQVNGKLRGSIRVAAGADRAAIESAVLADETTRRYLMQPPKKIIIVPGKLVNVVL